MWQWPCCSSFNSLRCLALLRSILTGSWWALGLEREESTRGAWTQGCSYSCTHFGQPLTACAAFWFLSPILTVGSTESARSGAVPWCRCRPCCLRAHGKTLTRECRASPSKFWVSSAASKLGEFASKWLGMCN